VSAPLAAARAGLTAPALAPLSRRTGALLLDLAIAVVALQLIAPPVYVASGGRAQLLNAPLGAWRCETISPASSETTRAVGPRACRRSLFGFPFASALRGGAAGAAAQASGEIDAAGRPVAAIDLGWLLAPLFVLVRLWFEAFGMRTPGRALFSQRLVGRAPGRGDHAGPAVATLAVRYGAMIAPFLAAAGLAGAASAASPAAAGTATGLAALVVFVVYGGAALAILRGRRPFHDRAAGTQVIAATGSTTKSARPRPLPPS
jgi:hypothetical protein